MKNTKFIIVMFVSFYFSLTQQSNAQIEFPLGLHVDEDQSVLFGKDTGVNGTRVQWNPSLGAFRAGRALAGEWNYSILGYYSAAFGQQTEARGDYSFAAGLFNHAYSIMETSFGRFSIGGGDSQVWIPTDPLFEIGNGSNANSRANAVTVLKNGETIISDLAGTGIRNVQVDAEGRLIASSSTDDDGTVTDIDGNTYLTIEIGTQTWMKENLRVKRYKDGTPIARVDDSTDWLNSETGKYCFYDNDENYELPHGLLYNWFAVADTRGLCPEGWHVPSITESNALSNFLGGNDIAGGKMKVPSTDLWFGANVGATNESGFTGIPGGVRGDDGDFSSISTYGLFWTETESNTTSASSIFIFHNDDNLNPNLILTGNKPYGSSVRCLQD